MDFQRRRRERLQNSNVDTVVDGNDADGSDDEDEGGSTDEAEDWLAATDNDNDDDDDEQGEDGNPAGCVQSWNRKIVPVMIWPRLANKSTWLRSQTKKTLKIRMLLLNIIDNINYIRYKEFLWMNEKKFFVSPDQGFFVKKSFNFGIIS